MFSEAQQKSHKVDNNIPDFMAVFILLEYFKISRDYFELNRYTDLFLFLNLVYAL